MKTLLASILVLPLLAQAQKPQPSASTEQAKTATEEGIPVTSQLVISKCGGCHTKDDKGNMLRISWERATPEGWEEAIKRMVRLRGVDHGTRITFRAPEPVVATSWSCGFPPRRDVPDHTSVLRLPGRATMTVGVSR